MLHSARNLLRERNQGENICLLKCPDSWLLAINATHCAFRRAPAGWDIHPMCCVAGLPLPRLLLPVPSPHARSLDIPGCWTTLPASSLWSSSWADIKKLNFGPSRMLSKERLGDFANRSVKRELIQRVSARGAAGSAQREEPPGYAERNGPKPTGEPHQGLFHSKDDLQSCPFSASFLTINHFKRHCFI